MAGSRCSVYASCVLSAFKRCFATRKMKIAIATSCVFVLLPFVVFSTASAEDKSKGPKVTDKVGIQFYFLASQ